MRFTICWMLATTILVGCNSESLSDSGSKSEPAPQDSSVSFSVSVPEELKSNFINASVTARQIDTDNVYQSTMDDEATATFTVDTYDDDEPLEITITNNNQLFKGLSSGSNLLRATKLRAASRNITITITPESTARFAYLDANQDGRLSRRELKNREIKLSDAESEGLLLVAAAMEIYAINGAVEGTQSRDNYHLALDMFKSESLTNIVKVKNQREMKRILDRDYPSQVIINQPNPESEDFFRIDINGDLLSSQSLAYQLEPWMCVDDLRSRSRPLRNYGYGINIWHYDSEDNANQAIELSNVLDVISQLNSQTMCNVANWSIPTLEEFESLLENNSAKFPLSFPFLNTNLYWVNQDNSRQSINAAIYDISQSALSTDGNVNAAAIIYKSFTRVDKDRLQRQVDQTRDEINAAYANVKALYANPDPATWPAPSVDEGIAWLPLGKLPAVEHPSDNPYSLAAYNLGKRLFFEPRLSQERDVACSTCHTPAQGWDDNLQVSVGHNGLKGTRNAPSIINTAYQKTLFWDGRATSLENQALQPIANPIEMNLPLDELESRIAQGEFSDYGMQVKEAFGNEQLTTEIIAQSLAMFQRSIVSGETKFDRFLEGETKLSSRELWGLHLFRTKARCMNCHSGPNFTNNEFEDLGLSDYNRRTQDLGLYNTTLDPNDSGKFKVASLRELVHTAPYMHTGRFDLEEAVTAYNNAMGVKIVSSKLKINELRYDPLFPEGSDKLHVLNLTESEITAIVDFLETLSSAEPPVAP